jgi:hypothetical protein
MVPFKVWVTEIDRYIQLFCITATLKSDSLDLNRHYTTHLQKHF